MSSEDLPIDFSNPAVRDYMALIRCVLRRICALG